MRRWRAVLSLELVVVLCSFTSVASAEQVTATLQNGDGAAIQIQLSDDAGDGTLVGRVQVSDGSLDDLQKLQLNLGDDSLLDGLTVTGDVTSFSTSQRSRDLLGPRAQARLAARAKPVDLAIKLDPVVADTGTGDEGVFIEFVIAHDTETLTLDLLADQLVGVRVTPEDVQEPDVGGAEAPAAPTLVVATIPEPSTGVLLYLGLLGLGPAARALRSSR